MNGGGCSANSEGKSFSFHPPSPHFRLRRLKRFRLFKINMMHHILAEDAGVLEVGLADEAVKYCFGIGSFPKEVPERELHEKRLEAFNAHGLRHLIDFPVGSFCVHIYDECDTFRFLHTRHLLQCTERLFEVFEAAEQTMKSNSLSWEGSAAALPRRNFTLTPASRAFCRAMFTKSWLISIPVMSCDPLRES